MSRLDSFIRRLEAQRTILNWAAASIQGRSGLALELGLGNGRTYDHLRELLPGREIYVFERDPHPNPLSRPPARFLVVGDMAETLPVFEGEHGAAAALIHVDVTTGVPERDKIAFAWLPARVAALAMPGAIIVSGWALEHDALEVLPLPEGIPEGRYFAYRRAG
ncbi:class I SAM-dependent methyltransferase [uncultured Bosea sp.]|uniref:class I SAM-dependent methyltransferase n=1 Tax=uncultured Bosea sp. TaxID=211457 RepID=UPI0025E8C2DE|nr:class I SAM-dependent methyltransferase [uncultured Bosea sp.]